MRAVRERALIGIWTAVTCAAAAAQPILPPPEDQPPRQNQPVRPQQAQPQQQQGQGAPEFNPDPGDSFVLVKRSEE
ncbi:MAG: hypothetical protein ACF8R7_04175, partial [Phycisphaerales bacterium JB039]